VAEKVNEPRLADAVVVRVSARDRERQWQAVESRLGRRRVSWWMWALAGVVAAGGIAIAWFAQSATIEPRVAPQEVVIAPPTLPPPLLPDVQQLADGSSLRERGAELVVRVDQPERVEIELHRGEIEMSVPQRGDRRVQITAGRFRIFVQHATLVAAYRAEELSIDVVAGSVLVDVDGKQHELSTGTWSSKQHVATTPERDSPRRPTPREPREPQPRTSPPNETSMQLLADAGTALRRKDPSAAVVLYDRVWKQFPDDPRAPVAALASGRIYLDELHQLEAAREAFTWVLETTVGSSLKEDALAQLVVTHDRRKDVARCAASRSRYLAEYPAGAYRTMVRQRCTKRP
jgi:hypothetical protein